VREKANGRLKYSYVKEQFAVNGCELLSDTYVNAHTLMEYRCVCGNLAKINYSNFKSGRRCNKCRYRKIAEKKRHSYEDVKKYFANQGCKLLSKDYKNNKTPLEYVCICGRKSTVRFDNFKTGARCRDCYVEKVSGDGSYMFNPNLTPEQREVGRNFKELRDWRKAVFERDQYTCTKCGKKGGYLNAHHLLAYDTFPDWRENVYNGVTLCRECHTTFHRTYGYGGNYFSQFLDWNVEWHYRSIKSTGEAAASQFDF
jgi:hypothetical protein